MLCSQNSGKYLSGEFARDREQAFRDRSRYSSDDLARLEVPSDTSRYEERTYKVDTQPLDPDTRASREKIDIRDLPGRGGR